MVKGIPEGYGSVTPYLIVEGAARLLDFLKEAFGAQERARMPGPNGTIGHAEALLGDSVIMLADAGDQWPARPGTIHLYVEDCDAAYERAVTAGATSIRKPRTEFYGDRMAGVDDPLGNQWWIATRVEDVSPEELARRSAELAAQAES
jgi:PhnB protein